MKTLKLKQGSPEWHKARLEHFTASEASAMMGDSKHQTRNELLQFKKTGITTEVDTATQRRFDEGHQAEADFRPHAEKVVDDELFPVTGVIEIEGLPLLASFDGLTMLEDTAFEHKLWNDKLCDQVESKNLDLHYIWQLEQQLLVSGANNVLFVTSDGTTDKVAYLWYQSNPELRRKLIAGWHQFKADLDTFELQEEKQKPVAEAVKELPSVTVQVKGELTVCNLKEITPQFDSFLNNAITKFETDEDFANAEAQAKVARSTAKKCGAVAEQVIDQMLTVSDAIRTLNEYKDKFNALGLAQEKAVKTEKQRIKQELINNAKQDFEGFISAINTELSPIKLIVRHPDLDNAVKSKRTMASLRNAVDTELANSKAAANETANLVRANLKALDELAPEHKFLFNDLQNIVHEDHEPFTAIVISRVAQNKVEQEKRIEAERKRIRQEEELKAKETLEATTKTTQPAKEETAVQPPAESKSVSPIAATFINKEQSYKITNYDDREALEYFFGDEEIHNLNYDEDETEYELELTVKRVSIKQPNKAAA